MPSQASTNAVAAVFQNVFGRAPTSQESSGWASQLDGGATAAQLAAALAGSPEGAADISALYQQILGRGLTNISSSEIAAGQAYLAQDKTNGLASLRVSMASSTEAQADIKAVYQNVLGRAASTTEVSNAETALASGSTLAQLYTSAEASPELTANLTKAYQGAFHATPSTSALTFLRQQVVSGDTFSSLGSALSSQATSSGGGTTVTTSNGANGTAVNGTSGAGGANGANGAAVAGASGTSASNAAQTSSAASDASLSLPATFNPAESMLSSGSGSSAASVTARSSTTGSALNLVQLTNPATVGIAPTLHSS